VAQRDGDCLGFVEQFDLLVSVVSCSRGQLFFVDLEAALAGDVPPVIGELVVGHDAVGAAIDVLRRILISLGAAVPRGKGESLACSSDHRLYSQGQWKPEEEGAAGHAGEDHSSALAAVTSSISDCGRRAANLPSDHDSGSD